MTGTPSGLPLDDACTKFVRWLTAKTLEHRARWEKHPNGLIAHLTASTFAQFVAQASEEGQSWRLFRVRDSRGEFIRATSPVPAVETSPLTVAVQVLFLTLMWTGSNLIQTSSGPIPRGSGSCTNHALSS